MRCDMLFITAPIPADDPEGLVDGLACGDIRSADFVKRYRALGYSREEALAVVEDNRILGNLES